MMKTDRKYCCDPFKEHKTLGKKDLRDVTEEQAKNYPSMVSFGLKICSGCRKKLCKLPAEMVACLQPQHTEMAEQISQEETGGEANEQNDSIFSNPDSELYDINKSLELIGESPLKKSRMETSSAYVQKKKKKVKDALSSKISAACSITGAASISHQESSSDETDDKEQQILQGLINKYKSCKDKSERLMILTIFAKSWSRRKVMAEFGCSQRMATNAKRLAIERGILSTPNPRVGRTLAKDTVIKVKEFYYQDDISRVMPGKKDCYSIYVDGQKQTIQKRLILGNLKELYQKFKETNKDDKIGFSKFAMLRPKECVLAGSNGTHSVCVCTIHNNVKLMMSGAQISKVTENEEVPFKHYSHILARMMCNPPLPECHLGCCEICPGKEPIKELLSTGFEEKEIDEIEYKQWTNTDRSKLETVVMSSDDFVEEFLDRLDQLKAHDFISKRQAMYLNHRKERLGDGEFVVIGDFSENYSFVVQDAAQSFHWNNSTATIHPFVYYYKQGDEIKHGNFVLISEYNTHDTVAVHLFQKLLIQHLIESFTDVEHLCYFSDGCAGQYKNKKNFLNLCLHEHDFGMSAEWHFFATSHGKGPSDGIGGTIKREAARASLQRIDTGQILSPIELHEFVKDHLHGINSKFVMT